MLKFSKETNAKLKSIKEWSPIEKPRVYSFSLLSGFSCPKALDCNTYAVADKVTGKRKVVDVFLLFKRHNITKYTTKENIILIHYLSIKMMLIRCIL